MYIFKKKKKKNLKKQTELKENNWAKLKINTKIINLLKTNNNSEKALSIVPSQVQKHVAGAILNSDNVIFHSQTGSGKTLAYLLPTITNLLKKKISGGDLVILLNSHGLAEQTFKEVRKFISKKDCVLLTVSSNKNEKGNFAAKRIPAVIVATPKAYLDFYNQTLKIKNKPKIVVIDEVDQTVRNLLIVRKYIRRNEKPIVQIIRKVSNDTKGKAQLIACSATYCQIVEAKLRLLGFDFNGEEKVSRVFNVVEEGNKIYSLPQNIKHFFTFGYFLDFEKRVELFLQCYRQEKPLSALLISPEGDFNNTELLKKLKANGLKAEILREDITRTEIVDKFHSGEIEIAVTNEYCHRGLDFDFLTHVFVWDASTSDKSSELYLHVSGRLGRPIKGLPFLAVPGRCITLVDQEDLERIEKVENKLGIKFERLDVRD